MGEVNQAMKSEGIQLTTAQCYRSEFEAKNDKPSGLAVVYLNPQWKYGHREEGIYELGSTSGTGKIFELNGACKYQGPLNSWDLLK